MIIDGGDIEAGRTLEADACIVGAGPAGLTLAMCLESALGKVIVVESGGVKWDERAQELAAGEVCGDEYFPIEQTRIRGIGGTTRAWAGLLVPFSACDFSRRSWLPWSGWPICSDEMKGYYSRALSLTNAKDFQAEWSAEDNLDGFVRQRVYRVNRRWFGRERLGWLKRAKNLHLVLNSSVIRLEASDAGRHISGAVASNLRGAVFRVRATVFVVAAGAIENARLLLVSNEVCRNGLGNDHDLVGRFFMEHPRFIERFKLNDSRSQLEHLVPGVAGSPTFARLGLSNERQRQDRLLNYQVSLSFGYSGQDGEVWEAIRRFGYASLSPWRHFPYYVGPGGGRNRLRWLDLKTALGSPFVTARCLAGYGLRLPFLREWLQVDGTVEQPPSADNRVVLSAERDRFGNRLPRLILTISEELEETHRVGLCLLMKELEKIEPGISNSRVVVEGSNSYFSGTWHHMGTTRMDENPKLGVVDRHCRVFDIDNLFVAGSSVFSTGSVHSPTLTIIALSIRLAEHLMTSLRAN